MNLVDRVVSPTPTFFQRLRYIGLALAAVSGAIVAAPIALPAMVVTVAGYLAVAGTVVGAVSQITIPEDK
jgi:ABC-type xylose transport system permease subunit